MCVTGYILNKQNVKVRTMLTELVTWSMLTEYEGSVKFINLSMFVYVPRKLQGMFFSYKYTGIYVIYVEIFWVQFKCSWAYALINAIGI